MLPTILSARLAGLSLAAMLLLASSPAASVAQDSVEFLNGTVVDGKILEIRKESKEFDFASQISGRTFTRTYPYSKVHAVTYQGKRFELTPKPASAGRGGGVTSGEGAETTVRSKAEVLRLIEEAGNTPPEWFADTPLDPPGSLDLSWPIKTPGPWNENKNVGQYIWGRINPNEARWHAGIKLVHHCMSLHQGNRQLLQRDMEKLGTMYFELLQDYPRAAFWYQKAGATAAKRTGIHLAECYWRLGNREMAMAMLRSRTLQIGAIKLLGDMGDIVNALKVAGAYANTQLNHEAYLAAGDALRKAGRLDQAITYYQLVLDSEEARNEDYKKRFDARAAGAIEAIRLFDRADVSRVADGTYHDKSTGYNGPVNVEVRVANHRIEAVKVTSHNEKQFYAALEDTPRQIIETQGIREIDGTTGATITSQAIIHATARALAQGAQ